MGADRYRPLLEERLTRWTGQPASIARLDIDLLPIPTLTASSVSLGSGDFRAESPMVSARIDLTALARGILDISRIHVYDLIVVLPEKPADAAEKLKTLGPEKQSQPQGQSPFDVTLTRIEADAAKLFLGQQAKEPVLVAEVAVENVLEPAIFIHGDGALIGYGEGARIRTDLQIDTKAGGEIKVGVSGTFSIDRIDTGMLLPDSPAPALVANMYGTIERTGPALVALTIGGSAAPVQKDPRLDALSGAFEGAKAWWDNGDIIVNDFHWASPGMDAVSDITVGIDQNTSVLVNTFSMNAAGIEAVLSANPPGNFTVTADPGAVFTARDITFDIDPSRHLILGSGTGEFSGIHLAIDDGARAFSDIHGRLSVANRSLVIENLVSEGFTISGTVTPDFADQSYGLDLKGELVLTRERVLGFVDANGLSEAQGTLRVSRFTASVVSGEGAPNDLRIEGDISGGVLGFDTEGWKDRLTQIEGTFAAEADSVATQLAAKSQQLGDVSVKGSYLIEQKRWDGTVSGDLTAVKVSFGESDAAKKITPDVLRAFGSSTFHTIVTLPESENGPITLEAARSGVPRLNADITWSYLDDAYGLGELSLDADLPADAVRSVLPESLIASGPVAVQVDAQVTQETLAATVDMTEASLEIGSDFQKETGTPAVLHLTGTSGAGQWAADTLTLDLDGQTISGRMEKDRFVSDDIHVDLSGLNSLLRDGRKTSGTISGRFTSAPATADLTLSNAHLDWSQDVGLGPVNGRIVLGENGVAFHSLVVHGANSDCELNGEERAGAWSGSLQGDQLDLNAIEALYTAITKLTVESEETAETATTKPASPPKRGSFTVNLGRVLYRRAQFTDASATVRFDEKGFHIDKLSAVPGSGSLHGNVDFSRGTKGAPGQIRTVVSLDHVDARTLDGLAFAESRDIAGQLTGSIDLVMPAGGGATPIHGANGVIRFTGESGSFGKLGIATKVVTLLRTTEIIKLRLPSVRDKGLTFDTCQGELVFENGVMRLAHFEARTPSYEIKAAGQTDFPRDAMDLEIVFNPMETVTGVAKPIPILGEIIGKVGAIGGIPIKATGPIADPKVGISAVGILTRALPTGKVESAEPPAGEFETLDAGATPPAVEAPTGGEAGVENSLSDELIEKASEAVRDLVR
ncbi:MAG: hypothetical protein AMXMBFR84_00980 [Candidatus Hydrogenedentota bacterium]